jgi:hypothetical protein
LRLSGKTLEDLLPRPPIVLSAVCFKVENISDEEAVQVPSPDKVYLSATTGRIRKCPERLQVSHSPPGPKMHCPMCQSVVTSTRSLSLHKKLCKKQSIKSLDTLPAASKSPLNASEKILTTAEECPVSIKRSKPSKSSSNRTDVLDDTAEVSDEMSEQFSDTTEECSEWDEVDTVEIKIEYDEDVVKLQDTAAQTDTWCPETASTFYCVPCRCQFRTSNDLRQHALDVHRESADSTLSTLGGRPSQGIKMVKYMSGVSCFYECPYCRTLRVDVAQLLRHIRQQHPSQLFSVAITCKKAPVKMMKSVRLDQVMKQRYFCGYCRTQLESLGLLKKHLEKSHLVRECVKCISFFQVKTLASCDKGRSFAPEKLF